MTRFVPNRRLEEQIRKQAQHRRALKGAANEAKRHAEAAAPRGTSHRGVAERFVVVEEDGEVRVGNTDPFFHLVEFGSAKNPPYAPLRRGVRAAGLRLDEEPK